MAIAIYDRVKETTTTTGTGTITLSGAVSGFQSFNSTVAVGNITYYGIIDNVNSVWEIGTGTLVTSTTLSRTAVLASTNSNALVNFSAGTKDVFIEIPASKAVAIDYVMSSDLSGTLSAPTLSKAKGLQLVKRAKFL